MRIVSVAQQGLFLVSVSIVWGCKTPPQEFTYLETTSVRITELHYDPSSEQGSVEFIEVSNVTGQPVDLGGWQLTGAGRVLFPDGELGPRESLVFCEDAEAFRRAFGSSIEIAGTLPGKLRNKGETVRVEDPQGRVADEVAYDPADPEVEKAAGTGLSIHRLPGPDGSDHWRAAKPTPGASSFER